jgi:hypothetical protein
VSHEPWLVRPLPDQPFKQNGGCYAGPNPKTIFFFFFGLVGVVSATAILLFGCDRTTPNDLLLKVFFKKKKIIFNFFNQS